MPESSIKTNVIKLQFTKSGVPGGREYTYFTPVDVAVGDVVEFEGRKGLAKGVVTQINVPEGEIAPFKDRAKTIIGKVKESQQEAP